MFIAYQKQRGIEYARLMESVRVDGCVMKKSGPNLGRVLDKERGIYQSKERGIFTFDLKTNTYGKPPQSYVSNVRRKNAREKLIVDYGDAFLLTRFWTNTACARLCSHWDIGIQIPLVRCFCITFCRNEAICTHPLGMREASPGFFTQRQTSLRSASATCWNP